MPRHAAALARSGGLSVIRRRHVSCRYSRHEELGPTGRSALNLRKRWLHGCGPARRSAVGYREVRREGSPPPFASPSCSQGPRSVAGRDLGVLLLGRPRGVGRWNGSAFPRGARTLRERGVARWPRQDRRQWRSRGLAVGRTNCRTRCDGRCRTGRAGHAARPDAQPGRN